MGAQNFNTAPKFLKMGDFSTIFIFVKKQTEKVWGAPCHDSTGTV